MKHNVLSISLNEKKVFESLRKGLSTPLLIAEATSIPRPTVYVTLDDLKSRGLIETYVISGKKLWRLKTKREINEELYAAKRFLFDLSEGREENHSAGDSFVIVYRGQEAIHKLLGRMFKEHKNERFYGFQGNTSTSAWESIFPVAAINEINRSIKKNNILVHAVLEKGWALETAKKFGTEWVKDFEGRTTSAHELPSKYMQYSTEVWIFKNSIYMLAPKEELVVEIENSGLVVMMKSLFSFVQDSTPGVDINKILRDVTKTQ